MKAAKVRSLGVLWLVLSAVPLLAATVPAPESVLGHRPGADHKLADYATLVKYFRTLDAASERVRVREIGPTAENRTMIAAFITSEANHAKLEHYREISKRLALAQGLDDAAARALAAEGKAVVWIDFGLHATEVAPAQAAPELAYRVASEESDEMRRIREDVIFILVPVMNPDGLDKVCAWYKRNLGTPYEAAPMVELYHKYVGHDNNRDWFMFTMPESRNVARLLYSEWFPQIVYNQHQTAPFPARIFVPPFAEPMNPNIPPQVMRGIATVGDAIASRLEAEGKAGVVSGMRFDTWWNGGMRTAPYFHNMVGILTETALWRYATPHRYDPAKLPKKFRDSTVATDTPSTSYPNPWRGGEWRLRDAVDYIITASLATLDVGSERRADWLYGMYLMGKAAIESGAKGDPFAYVIPPTQRDPGAVARLVEVLGVGGVEVKRASRSFRAGEKEWVAGSLVVPMAQPFRAYAKDLLEIQKYPERRVSPSGPPIPPYDITGWTLPAQMGVETVRVDKPFEAPLDPVAENTLSPGRVEGEGGVLVADPAANAAFVLANRVLKIGGKVSRAMSAFKVGGRELPPGAFVFEGDDRAPFEAFARDRGLVLTAIAAPPTGSLVALRAPRIGLYKSWVPSMDEGWTRFVLEQHEFAYTPLLDADVREGNLAGRFDVIVLPDSPANQILRGHAQGGVPPEFAAGLGLEGALALKRFVSEGGTLVALDSASDLPVDLFGLGLRNVLRGVPRSEYFCPGALLRAQADPSHPLAFGLPKEFVVFVENGPAFALDDEPDEDGEEQPPLAPLPGGPPRIVASFAETSVLHSGWLLGEAKIAKKGILAEAPFGAGRVVLVGFRCQFRGQSLSTFKVLFNALLRGVTAPVKAARSSAASK